MFTVSIEPFLATFLIPNLPLIARIRELSTFVLLFADFFPFLHISHVAQGEYVASVLLEALVVIRELFRSAELTGTSPSSVLAWILRFFALGGVLGGASATVAFFLPRGIAGKQKLDLEVAVPILENVERCSVLISEASEKPKGCWLVE